MCTHTHTRYFSFKIRLAFLSTEGRVQKEITKFVGTSTSLTPTFAQSFDFPANSEGVLKRFFAIQNLEFIITSFDS